MQAYITSRNLMSVIDLAEQLAAQRGITGVKIIDCGSTYQPLLDQYRTLPKSISVLLAPNLGPRAVWALETLKPPYLVTDGDLSIDGWPDDAILQMRTTLYRLPGLIKSGAALRLDDLPDNELTREVRLHESEFWGRTLTPCLHPADIDTTLAVYNVPNWGGYGPAVRHGNLQARHLPWYVDPTDPPPDYAHNFTAKDHKQCTHWTDKMRTTYQRSRG
jgi:hypothetical protein